ncbi:hypothetical protein ACP70R_012158 [Stipagrostis hirtigluma subsp. patula]
MGRRPRRRAADHPPLEKRRRRGDDPPHMERPAGDIEARLRKSCWIMLALFETPSGFAIISFDGFGLYAPDAIENIWARFATVERARNAIWVKEVKNFEDKSSAINFDTGVSDTLTAMILRYHRPGQILAVGKPDYKRIITARLGIECVCDENVMEVMWGLNNIMQSVNGKEKIELTKEERLPMSQGLKMLLDRHGFDVKPEKINMDIVEAACVLHDCYSIESKYSLVLRSRASRLKDVSGINSEDWDVLKLATAVKMICYPDEYIIYGDTQQMFSKEELAKLESDAHRYDRMTFFYNCMQVYDAILDADVGKVLSKRKMRILTEKAKEADEAASLPSIGLASAKPLKKSMKKKHKKSMKQRQQAVSGLVFKGLFGLRNHLILDHLIYRGVIT